MRRFNPKELLFIAAPPLDDDGQWFRGAESSVEFLLANALADEIVIFAAAPMVSIVGALAPMDNVTPPDGEDLQNTTLFTDSSWKIQKSWSSEGHRVYLEPPFPGPSGRSLAGGEPLLHRRVLHGVQTTRPRIELSEKLHHCLDVYYLPERSAYCRLDKNGDIEDVIRVAAQQVPGSDELCEFVTILRKDLDAYMALAGMALVLKFDFTRFTPSAFNGWNEGHRINRDAEDLFFHGGGTANASYVNGAMVVRTQVTVSTLEDEWRLEFGRDKEKSYAKFKIHDRKNDRDLETSCSPKHIVSYFEKSELPWHISPAFFRPEVLHRFKADPEKYTLEERSISCRGAWHLKTYDINEAGQVHTYIGYLADLPYEEQMYWATFNEWPKGPISPRAHKTDILGEWQSDYDPLMSLKSKVRKLDETRPAWWSARGPAVVDAVLAPATDSPKEWADEILALDQLVVEGFIVTPLRAIARKLGRPPNDSWASLRVLGEILVGKGFTPQLAKERMAPLAKLHALRTEIRGHATSAKKEIAIREARAEHGNFRAQYYDLAAKCDEALGELIEILKQSNGFESTISTNAV